MLFDIFIHFTNTEWLHNSASSLTTNDSNTDLPPKKQNNGILAKTSILSHWIITWLLASLQVVPPASVTLSHLTYFSYRTSWGLSLCSLLLHAKVAPPFTVIIGSGSGAVYIGFESRWTKGPFSSSSLFLDWLGRVRQTVHTERRIILWTASWKHVQHVLL